MSPTQKQIWNKIAPEWYEFKDNPNLRDIAFVKSQKGKLLDIGCGAGRHFTKTKAEIYAVDFSKEMINYAKKRAENLGIKNIQFFVSDSAKLAFENNFFDSAVCISVLHCIHSKKNRQEALKELYRVLKPKAQVKIAVWNKESGRFKNKNKEDYVRWRDKGKRYYYFYTEDELEKELEEVGFKIKKRFPSDVNISFIIEKVRD